MALKVAIVGLAEASRAGVPWDDPEWEIWGLAWDSERYRMHRVFEMHDMPTLARVYADIPAYLEKLSHCVKVYTQGDIELRNAERFPFEEVSREIRAYWESSIAYAMSLAITEGAEKIGVYGVNMKAREEYAYQRPNMEYLIGFAEGRGIKVHIPDASPLLKFSGFDGYAGRYGKAQ
jgi:hypothetical protein